MAGTLKPPTTATAIPTRPIIPGGPPGAMVSGPLTAKPVDPRLRKPLPPALLKGGSVAFRFRATLGDAYARMVKEAQPPAAPVDFNDPKLWLPQPGDATRLPGKSLTAQPATTSPTPAPSPFGTSLLDSGLLERTKPIDPNPGQPWQASAPLGQAPTHPLAAQPPMISPTQPSGPAGAYDPKWRLAWNHNRKPQLGDEVTKPDMATTEAAARGIIGGALGAAVTGPAASGIMNFFRGAGNLARARFATGPVQLSPLTGNPVTPGQQAFQMGLWQAGVKAPMYGTPAAIAGTSNTILDNPTFTPQTPGAVGEGDRGLNALTSTVVNRLALPFSRTLNTIPGMPGPGLGDYFSKTWQGGTGLGQKLVSDVQPALRTVGNQLTDAWHEIARPLGIPNDASRFEAIRGEYKTLNDAYRAGTGAFAGLDDAARLNLFNEQVKGLQARTNGLNAGGQQNMHGYSRAYNGLMGEAVLARMTEAGYPPEQIEAVRRQFDTVPPITDPNYRMGVHLHTDRDVEAARARTGLDGISDPGVRQARRGVFDREVDEYMAANLPPIGGATQPATPSPQPAGTGFGLPAEGPSDATSPVGQPQPPGPTAPAVPQSPLPPSTPNVPGQQPQPKIDLPETSPEKLSLVASNVGKMIATGGGLGGVMASAAAAPPPPGFGTYWAGLPVGSKVLAIGGLSIAAITALRSMFGGDDEEDEPSFLMKVLPFLGLGAAAWGLGGGTLLGFGDEENFKIPEMKHYKALGNAVTSNVGMGSVFD